MTAIPLPFSGATTISRHHSAEAARLAMTDRASKTQTYLRIMAEAGEMGLTDHQVAAMCGWPLSSVNSIRAGCGALIAPRSDARAVSPYGRSVTIWRRV